MSGGRAGVRIAVVPPGGRCGVRLRAGLLLAALAAFVPAMPAAAAVEDRRIAVRWLVTWGGLPVFKVKFGTRIANGRYTAEFHARSRGVVELAAKTRTFWRTAGRVAGSAMVPEWMRQRYNMKRGGNRLVMMAWTPSGAIATHIAPPEPSRKRKKVPEAMQRHAVDPVTAILNGLVAPRDGPPCTYAARIFEGRRRIDIRLSYIRHGRTPRVKVRNLPRRSMVCLLHARRLAGFRDRHFREVPKLHPLKLWIVRLDKAGIWLPVEMAMKTPYGIARARLTSLKLR